MAKEDNINNSATFSDSVETVITENPVYFRISDNLKYEHNILIRLKNALSDANAISVRDIEALMGYMKDIEELMIILMDYQHTINILNEFDKVFKLREVNGNRFVIKITSHNRKKRRRVKRKYRNKLNL